jgi:hypothetical protein
VTGLKVRSLTPTLLGRHRSATPTMTGTTIVACSFPAVMSEKATAAAIACAYRDADHFDFSFGTSLPSSRLQYETACAALQSEATTLTPGAATHWTFFGFYLPHPVASSDADLTLVDVVERV